MYFLIKNLLFLLDPERAHSVALKTLKIFYRLKLIPLIVAKVAPKPVTVWNITFPNAVGLAAGLDKNAEYVDALHALGFGFIEVGTVTPRPQVGHKKPRLFRLPGQQALINRMGFNNCGLEEFIENLKKIRSKPILGINIGKNSATPPERAVDDYLECLTRVYPYASYITINISSPNTAGLRDLQYGEKLHALLSALKHRQQQLAIEHARYVPLAVKVSPDLSLQEIEQMASMLLEHKIDGVIATNTTLSRPQVACVATSNEKGGLSGQPIQALSTQVLKQLYALLGNNIPLVGVGGIVDAPSAREKFLNGASLVQVYTGFIYSGPRLLKRIIEGSKL